MFAPKKDGTKRFCVDYRRLNALTVRDTYPIPRMDECIDSLGDAKVLTTLDCNAGYWQISLRREDWDKSTFVCHSGSYLFKRVPFGLTNAPATFQRTLDIVLSAYKWQTCLVYIDDIIIYSKNDESHFRHLEEVLSTLHRANISLKLEKCEFFTTRVRYLGHIIEPGRLSIDKAIVASLKEVKRPRTQQELRSFIGLCNVYRRFVGNFAHIAAPLNRLLQKGESVELTRSEEPQESSFRALIEVIVSPPVLALPKKGLPYSVDTDASSYQVGAALFQDREGVRKPIGYWSRSLHTYEKNYSKTEQECLALVWAVITLRPYLIYEHFTVQTDHAALGWLLSVTDPSGRLIRWRLRLAEFSFEILYKKGKTNAQADALSRLSSTGSTTVEAEEDDIPCFYCEVKSDNHTLATPHALEWTWIPRWELSLTEVISPALTSY